jgi:hypothetical protein
MSNQTVQWNRLLDVQWNAYHCGLSDFLITCHNQPIKLPQFNKVLYNTCHATLSIFYWRDCNCLSLVDMTVHWSFHCLMFKPSTVSHGTKYWAGCSHLNTGMKNRESNSITSCPVGRCNVVIQRCNLVISNPKC